MFKRRRIKQKFELGERLAAWIAQIQEQAAGLAPGPERDMLLTKVRQAEVASRLDDWARSPGLQPPK